jgi:hypothetical protein
MAKPSVDQRPKALDTLVAIIDLVIPHRYPDRDPSLSDIARLTSSVSGVLRFDNRAERTEVETAATLQIAKKRQLIS